MVQGSSSVGRPCKILSSSNCSPAEPFNPETHARSRLKPRHMPSSAFDLDVPAGPLEFLEQTRQMSMGEIRAARFAHYSREVADALFEPGVDRRDSVRRMRC